MTTAMNRRVKLIGSIIIDILGLASYLIPVWGEFSDAVFAFVEAGWIYLAYRNYKFAIFGGIEELLPFTDVIPACTITHIWVTIQRAKAPHNREQILPIHGTVIHS